MKRLFLLISLNVAYSTAELAIGLFTGRVGMNLEFFSFFFFFLNLSIFLLIFALCGLGLVSDAFHLTFGCGLLTFSMFAMAASRQKPDFAYTYG